MGMQMRFFSFWFNCECNNRLLQKEVLLRMLSAERLVLSVACFAYLFSITSFTCVLEWNKTLCVELNFGARAQKIGLLKSNLAVEAS